MAANNPDSGINLKELLTTIGAALGVITALGVILKSVLTPTDSRVMAVAAYLVCLVVMAWFVLIKAKTKKSWQLAALLAFYLASAPYFIWMGSWLRAAPGPNRSISNLVQRFDFEAGLPPFITLGVCDNISPWYNHCHEAPDRLAIAGSEKSLECSIEVSPDREQVYSIRLPVDPPVFVDMAQATVNLPDADMFTKVSLALHPVGENYWVFSDHTPHKAGWLSLFTDVQPFKSGREVAVDEIHLDLFVKPMGRQAQEKKVLVDNIELYFPLAQSFKTAP